MFTLYHIPKRKEWGCTKNISRRLEKLGYTILDVDKIIEIDNIDKASEMERELNLEYGYGWNESQDYRRVTKMGLIGAKIGGNKNVESGHIHKIQQRSVEVRTGTKHSEESKVKMSLARLGKTSPRKNVILSNETKIKMSEARKEYWKLKKQNKI